MSDCCFSSSPNWYCPKILDFDAESGLFAFGSRNSVVLFNVTFTNQDGTSRPVNFVGVLRFHTDRVSSLSFCNATSSPIITQETGSSFPPSSPLYLASVGDDLNVNVVDVKKKTLAFQHKEHKSRISAVCWSSLNGMSNWVVSGDEKGILILFNLTTNKIRRHVPNKSAGFITVLSCNPLSTNVVAIGYQGGLILILDLQNDAAILHRLSHHDGDIQSVSWAPLKGSLRLEGRNERSESSAAQEKGDWRAGGGAAGDGDDHLLASGSKDRTIKIWSTKDGTPIRTLNVPSNVGAGRRKANDDNTRSHAWVTVTWHNFDCLLTNSHFGELLSWNVNDNGKQPWTIMGGKEAKGHSRTIFNIVNNSTVACTVSLDRQICFWDITCKEGRCLFSMPTLGGFVYSLTFSPVNSGYLAIGCGDNMIRAWNMTTENNPYDVQKFWQGIKSKVTTLAWHPYKEGIIGFGTDEGRVGVYDVLTSKPPSLSMNFHKKVVYTVTWGPMCLRKESERDFRLYSCGDGIILLHNAKEMEKSASNLNKLISSVNLSNTKPPSRSDVSFNPDFSIMVIGNEDGNVELYETESLKLFVVISGLRKLIQSIRWHPKYTLSSTLESKCSYWLAIASRDVNIRVYDLREQLDKESSVKLSVPSFELVGHSAAVAALAWNPHLDGQLASSSFDGTVRVWDVYKMEVTACYSDHVGRVLCAVWNPLNPDQILSGGEDFTIRLWNVTVQEKEPKTQSCKGTFRKVGLPKEATSDVVDQVAELLKQREKEISNVSLNTAQTDCFTAIATKASNIIDDSKSKTAKKLETTSKKKKKTYKSMFPISNSKDNCGKSSLLSDCTLLVDRLVGDADDDTQFGSGDFVSLGAFGSRLDAYRLLTSEAENHAKGDNHDYELHLGIWKGNVQEVLRNAAKKEQLSDWLVAMAPIVSPSFWEEMCGLYTRQLVADGQPHKAVTYLLVNQKVYEAVNVLKNHVSYREAIILAKVRLMPSDPLIVELTEEWAERLVQEGNAEQAAKCYLGIGQSDKAVAVLSQRQEPASLRVAAYIAMKSGNLDSAFTYASRAAYECFVRQDEETFNQLIKEHPKLQPFLVVAVSHKLLCKSAAKDLVSNSRKWRKPEIDLLKTMREDLFNCCKVNVVLLDDEFIGHCCTCLTQDVFMPNTYKTPQILAFIAVKLSLGLLYAVKEKYVNFLEVIHSLLMVVQRNCDQNIVRWMFECIFPLDDDMTFLAHIDPNNGLSAWLELVEGTNLHRSFCSFCGSIEAYGAVARLHVILNEERRRLTLNNDLIESQEFESDTSIVSSVEGLTEKLLKDDQAEYSRLRLRLDYVRMAIAALNAKQRWATVPGHTKDNVMGNGDLSDLSQTLADHILDNPSVTTDQLEVEAQNVEEQLENATKKLVVEQFPDPYDSCCFLAECCSLMAKRLSDPKVTQLLQVVVRFGVRYSALVKHKTKLEQFLQGVQSI